ncbi:hypothetical protein [uncultured Clostridium sp.]|uniref:hypothetical protein n=1 Tax=uncultured Clostridium sp. TaxID=59620 RepID=UPI0026067F1F|nr:hypothetical protein [uncultured Clostridium sp.]
MNKELKYLENIYGERNLQLIEKLLCSNDPYYNQQAKIFVTTMCEVERTKARNMKFKKRMELKGRLTKFLKDFSLDIVPSDNLITFFMGIELEMILCKLFEIESYFAKKCRTFHAKTADDYEKLIVMMGEDDLNLNLDYEPVFTGKFKEEINICMSWLGSMLFKTYKYNEYMYNHETLKNELDSLSKKYCDETDNSTLWENETLPECFKGEALLWNEIYSKLRIFKDYGLKAIEKFETTLPGIEAGKDKKFFKSTVTRLENVLNKYKKLIEVGE